MIDVLLELIRYEMEYDLFDRDPGDIKYTYKVNNGGSEPEKYDVEQIDYLNGSVDVVIEGETYRISVTKLD